MDKHMKDLYYVSANFNLVLRVPIYAWNEDEAIEYMRTKITLGLSESVDTNDIDLDEVTITIDDIFDEYAELVS